MSSPESRLASNVAVCVCLMLFVGTCAFGAAVIREPISPDVCAALQEGRLLYLECRIPKGSAAKPFLAQYLANPTDSAKYAGRSSVAIRFEALKPRVQRAVLLAIFKEDVVTQDGWWHTALFGDETGLEILWSLCEWVTGAGANYGKVVADRRNQRFKGGRLAAGQKILIPAGLLLDAMREATEHRVLGEHIEIEDPDLAPVDLNTVSEGLTYGSDREGAYAVYRIRKGEALYTSVVVRFCDFRDNALILQACEIIRQRSGIRDVCDIDAGQKILIPVNMLSDRFRPAGSEQRRDYEQTIVEAKRLRERQVRTKDLEGVIVVIDPGHGGRDHGAPNAKHGLYEDELNYDVACRVKKILETRTRAKVHMTLRDPTQGYACVDSKRFAHDTDEYLLTTPHYPNQDGKVSVNLRWYLANAIYRAELKKGADPRKIIFTSFHTDALFNAGMRGAMVYIPGAKYRKSSERRRGSVYSRYKEYKEQPTSSSTASERRRDEALSRNFAEDLIDALGKRRVRRHLEGDPIRNVIRQAGGVEFVPGVLRNNLIPTKVLVEMANITNATDCSRLASPEWRQMFAEAYVDALKTHYGS